METFFSTCGACALAVAVNKNGTRAPAAYLRANDIIFSFVSGTTHRSRTYNTAVHSIFNRDERPVTELPGQVYLDDARPHIRVSRTDFYECPNLDSVVLTADISIFMDNGLPFAINSYDLD
jgi:hypothetical protein